MAEDRDLPFVIANNILLGLIAGLTAYLLASPYLPGFLIQIRQSQDPTGGYRYQSALASAASGKVDRSALAPAPKDNRVVIPSIGVDGPLLEGADAAILDKGIWHRPGTGTPGEPGNTVLVAHRFYELNGPNTFYSLDRLHQGDVFLIFWQGKEYDYTVVSSQVHPPTDVFIEDPTTDETVTLYTCTPLWSSVDRLVVVAKRITL